jgi:hypothetical protein
MFHKIALRLFSVGLLVCGLLGCAELKPTPDPVVLPARSIPCFEPPPTSHMSTSLDCSTANDKLLESLENHDEAVVEDLAKWNQVVRRQPGAVRRYDSTQWKYLVEALYVGQVCQRTISQQRVQRLYAAYSLAKHKLDLRPSWYDCTDERRILGNYARLMRWGK